VCDGDAVADHHHLHFVRRCRAAIDAGAKWAAEKERISPLNMVCKMQSGDGGGICDAKNIYAALDYVVDEGLVRNTDLDSWKKWASKEAKLGLPSGWGDAVWAAWDEGATWGASYFDFFVDISKPKVQFCRSVFSGGKFVFPPAVRVVDYVESRNLKRALLSGPAVATVRLTWEFQANTASLFNPSGTQTYCRQSKAGDSNDYCDPARKDDLWDQEQRDQQSSDAGEDTWYNHFVTLHGWGVKKSLSGENVPYWVVENSWGRIYENDNSPQIVNNGAGKRYVSSDKHNPQKNDSVVTDERSKNHFLLVADKVAGEGGLEMTNRAVFYAIVRQK
jgi:hypothetical protein